MDEVEHAISLALSFKTIHQNEKKDMRAHISRYGLASFESLLRVREHGSETDEERVYRRMGVTKKWVNERLR